MNQADAESNVRGFLQQCLSPESLAFMDGLIRRIEAEVDNPKPVDEGESSTQQDLLALRLPQAALEGGRKAQVLRRRNGCVSAITDKALFQ